MIWHAMGAGLIASSLCLEEIALNDVINKEIYWTVFTFRLMQG